MSKPANVDIHNLFRKFGGNPNDYQEIKQEDAENKSQQNWPIIAAMKSEMQNASQPTQTAPQPFRRHPAPEPAPQQVAPRHSVSSFLGSLETTNPSPAQAAEPAPTVSNNGRPDSLQAVFSRLHGNSQTQPEMPDNNLRNMLGRLIK